MNRQTTSFRQNLVALIVAIAIGSNALTTARAETAVSNQGGQCVYKEELEAAPTLCPKMDASECEARETESGLKLHVCQWNAETQQCFAPATHSHHCSRLNIQGSEACDETLECRWTANHDGNEVVQSGACVNAGFPEPGVTECSQMKTCQRLYYTCYPKVECTTNDSAETDCGVDCLPYNLSLGRDCATHGSDQDTCEYYLDCTWTVFESDNSFTPEREDPPIINAVNDKKGLKGWAIFLIVLAVLMLTTCCGFVLFFVYRKRKEEQQTVDGDDDDAKTEKTVPNMLDKIHVNSITFEMDTDEEEAFTEAMVVITKSKKEAKTDKTATGSTEPSSPAGTDASNSSSTSSSPNKNMAVDGTDNKRSLGVELTLESEHEQVFEDGDDGDNDTDAKETHNHDVEKQVPTPTTSATATTSSPFSIDDDTEEA